MSKEEKKKQSEEILDLTYKFIYAFNNLDTSVYDAIICPSNPEISEYEGARDSTLGTFMNDAFFNVLHLIHEEFGDMRLGYVKLKNGEGYVPYIEKYGYFLFSTKNNQIASVTTHKFDEPEVIEFNSKIEQKKLEAITSVPLIKGIEILKPDISERFSMKLIFSNKEIKKFVLPLYKAGVNALYYVPDTINEADEVIKFDQHVFTDKIWSEVKIVKNHPGKYKDYPAYNQGVLFKNGYFISNYQLYMESATFVEPQLCDELVYKDEQYEVRKIWSTVGEVWHDEEPLVLLLGQASNYRGITTFVSETGKRLTNLDFCYESKTPNGMYCVGIANRGYKLLDKNMQILPRNDVYYDWIQTGDVYNPEKLVAAQRNNVSVFLDKKGQEIIIKSKDPKTQYTDIEDFSEGLAKVSTLHIGWTDLAYHSDWGEIAGCWGYVNEKGEEVIAPQYIYATRFNHGRAIVCKGKWTKDKKWDNDCCEGGYWTDEELWGVIDKNGNEVIPCKYDEIRPLWDDSDENNYFYQVHTGGWKDGKWGIVDSKGNWLTEPVFDNYSYDLHGNLMVFYEDFYEEVIPDKDMLCGVYDLKNKKVLFEPQFLDVDFNDNGSLRVELFDEKQKKTIYKVIDLDGNELFQTQDCTYMYDVEDGKYMRISRKIGEEYCDGLLDSRGNIIIPCDHPAEIYPKQKLCVYKENGKAGMKDFDGNVIIKPQYFDIRLTESPFLDIQVGKTEDDASAGLITRDNKCVLPAKYKYIRFAGKNKIVAVYNDQYTDVFEYRKYKND